MQMVVYETYGGPEVLQLVEAPQPVPADDQVLVAIQAASINAYDWHLLTADIPLVRLEMGLTRPKNPKLGADIAGIVTAVGSQVRQFQPGEAVYGEIAPAGNGGLAEYAAVPERLLAPKPANLTFEEAAAVPMAALTALQGLRDAGQIQAGQQVLINGASGGVGTFAVQIAKALGAEVTAVCSTRNLEQARALGADHVIDYTRENFTEQDRRYDLILGVNGYHSLAAYKRVLAPGGRYVMAGGTPGQIFQAVLLGSLMSMGGDKQLGHVSAKASQGDLLFLNDWLESGQVRPIIDRRFPLQQAAEALAYLGQGHARGKVVITMTPDSAAQAAR